MIPPGRRVFTARVRVEIKKVRGCGLYTAYTEVHSHEVNACQESFRPVIT